MTEIILFLQFGLFLNILSFLIHLIASSVSAYNLGTMKTFEISFIAKNALENYAKIKRQVEPVRYFLELLSIFIPFYACWLFFKILTNYRRDIAYFTLPVILKMEEMKELAEKYNL